jgi:putative membrane protein
VNAIAQVFAVIAGLAHVVVFVLESFLLRQPAIARLFLVRVENMSAIRLWAVNQGFYNLFLALGALAGVIIVQTGNETVGRTLAIYACACMVGAGIVLFFSERRLWRGALGQAVPPMVAIIAALV